MCGIAGIIDFRGRPIEERLLRRFNECLAHRGPDDRGLFLHHADGFSAGLAHTRLAVIDPTPEGHQPMIDGRSRHALTYNGELFNYRTLRQSLADACRTQTDTEVVLNSLVQWGPAAHPRFDGMWALGFLDRELRAGLISRDPMGIKPLFYSVHDGRLIFASELKAIRFVPGLSLELDRDALDIYLHLGFIPHPFTIYRHIRKLPPGHMLAFDADGAHEPERFARPGGGPQERPSDLANPPEYSVAAACVRELVGRAVERQQVSDVSLGAFLSGGLDSSIVTACLAESSTSRVKTFSIGYADHARYDETRYAHLVASRFHTEHHEFRLTFRDVIESIEPALAHLGEPFADSSLLPTMLVSKHTRQHVTVALSGDGGDELFGGYWRYLAHDFLHRYLRLPRGLRKGIIEPLLRHAPSARSTRWLDRIRQARKLLRAVDEPDAMGRHLAWARWLEPATAAGLMGAERAGQARLGIEALYREASADSGLPGPAHSPGRMHGPEGLPSVLGADLAIGLPADMLFKVDAASMMHSLEVRVPLLSVDLVDYVTGLPLEYKIQGGVGKRILRDAFREVLPEPVLSRRKMGFEVPVGEFLRNELRELFNDTVRPDVLAGLGLDPAAAEQMYRDHAARRADHADSLWSLLVLCDWHRRTSPS